jgi:hypothetical protein
MKLTRRELAAALASGAALAQNSPRPPEASGADLDKAARERIRTNSQRLARHGVPMATEPAFQFRA